MNDKVDNSMNSLNTGTLFRFFVDNNSKQVLLCLKFSKKDGCTIFNINTHKIERIAPIFFFLPIHTFN